MYISDVIGKHYKKEIELKGFLWTSENELYKDDFPWRDTDTKRPV